VVETFVEVSEILNVTFNGAQPLAPGAPKLSAGSCAQQLKTLNKNRENKRRLRICFIVVLSSY
jgi:hypothetical protein